MHRAGPCRGDLCRRAPRDQRRLPAPRPSARRGQKSPRPASGARRGSSPTTAWRVSPTQCAHSFFSPAAHLPPSAMAVHRRVPPARGSSLAWSADVAVSRGETDAIGPAFSSPSRPSPKAACDTRSRGLSVGSLHRQQSARPAAPSRAAGRSKSRNSSVPGRTLCPPVWGLWMNARTAFDGAAARRARWKAR